MCGNYLPEQAAVYELPETADQLYQLQIHLYQQYLGWGSMQEWRGNMKGIYRFPQSTQKFR